MAGHGQAVVSGQVINWRLGLAGSRRKVSCRESLWSVLADAVSIAIQ